MQTAGFSLQRLSGGLSPLLAASLLPLAILIVVMLMVVPIPALLLDIFFIANIALSLVMLMVVLNANRPLDFSAFPAVLLFATLFRLALNVASTRIVLVAGHEGTDAAGKVIEAFGKALIGGNFVVGLIVFIILMIINLAVIAKGAGRVSEVSARFTLDALPGKQMAIDADLNAGMLTPEEARARRAEVATEADFYGSMDGASKFVKGDAVASILILVINIVGGLTIGMTTHALGFSEAVDLYLLLSVGDALVAQIPALLLSIAAAILVTRSTEGNKISTQLSTQFAAPAGWWPAAIILAMLAFIPGMPTGLILLAASCAGIIGWRLSRKPAHSLPVSVENTVQESSINWSDVGEAAAVNIEIGYGLIALVDGPAPLMGRITGIRRQVSRELGFVIPMVRVRDDLGLAPHSYRISISGEIAGEGEAWPSDLLALEAETLNAEVPGRPVRDPAFGLSARWIAPEHEAEAIAAGYTVVDPSTVIGTHLHKLLRERADTLFGQDEAHALIEALAQRQPQLAASIGPKQLPLPLTTAVMQTLLEESVPLKDFARIAGALAQVCGKTQEAADLAELVRERIGGLIVGGFAPSGTTLQLIALSPPLEQLLSAAQRASPHAAYPFEPGLSARLSQNIATAAAEAQATGTPVALVSQPGPRRALWRLLRSSVNIPVLAFTELPDSRAVEVIAVIGDGIIEPKSPDPDHAGPTPKDEETWTHAWD
ncbi:MAG: flagellar biosynthesis protein FlhA [Sandarakinorhabdus sp.]|nr:flagellar biosynthesis protein FlhA [Sandarakinorhabdus sp.]